MARKEWKVQANRIDYKLYRRKGTDIQISYSDNDPPNLSHQILVTGTGHGNVNRSFKSKGKAMRFMRSYMNKK